MWFKGSFRLTLMQNKIIKISAPLLLIALVALVYSNVLGAPFIFDDIIYIVKNTFIRDLSNFQSLAGTRYLAFLSFGINYAVGGLSPWGYHLLNITIHALNSVLVYLLIGGLFQSFAPGMGGEDADDTGFWLAFLTALIFAAHPMETEAVAYVTQRFTSLAAFFYLLSVVCYIRSRLAFIARKRSWGMALYGLAFIAGILAQKSKETAFTLPAIIILIEFLFFQRGRIFFKKGIFAFPFIGLFAIIPYELFYLTKGGGLEGIAARLRLLQLEELATLSRHDYFLTQGRVLITYIRLLFLPFGQRGDYDYAVYHSLFSAPVFFSFVFLILIFGGAVYLALRSARSSLVLPLIAAFGVLWFFITISVESSIVPIKDVIFEHRVYMPSVGVFLSAMVLYFVLAGRWRGAGRGLSRGLIIFPLVIVIVLSILTYRRNRVWGSDIDFWTDVVHKSPENARAYNNLGNAYHSNGQVKEAIRSFRRAIAIEGDYYVAYNNLGGALLGDGRLEEALASLKRAMHPRPELAPAYSNAALALVFLNRPGEAEKYARTALALSSGLAADAHNALGMALVCLGRLDEGLIHMREATRLNPASGGLWNNQGLAFNRAGRPDYAIRAFSRAVALEPTVSVFRANLERTKRDVGRREDKK